MKKFSYIIFGIILNLTSNNLVIAQAPLIVDHKAVDEFNQIPDYWIEEVKKMMINIPGESHGRGYMYGLESLQNINNKYAVNITWTGEPEAPTNKYLRGVRTYRNEYGNWSVSGGEQDFYTNTEAVENMKNHLNYMRNTANNPVSVFMFGWCWDMTWHNAPGGELDSEYYVHWAGASVGGPQGDLRWGLDEGDSALTGNSVSMETYISAVEAYNSSDPLTKTVFTTGPADNYSAAENGYQRYLKHQYIRNYVNSHPGSILFDYSDILSYNDNGEQYVNQSGWTDYNNVHHTYPTIHPDNKDEYDGGHGSCHISEAACVRLAKAMWWMMARIAGWKDSTVNLAPVAVNDTVVTDEDIPLMINVLSNDFDSDGDLVPSSVTMRSMPSHGETSINGTTGEITYSPYSNYNGVDSFTYTVEDDSGAVSNTADVLVTVNPQNDAPRINANFPSNITISPDIYFVFWLDSCVTDIDNDVSALSWTVFDTSEVSAIISESTHLCSIFVNTNNAPLADTLQFVVNDGLLSDTTDMFISIVLDDILFENDKQPKQYALNQNYPNPFNPLTTIGYSLPKASHVRLELFDLLGQKIMTLVNTSELAGYHEVKLNAHNLTSGIYLYKIQCDDFVQIKKLVVLK